VNAGEYLRRIEALNPSLGAFVEVNADAPRQGGTIMLAVKDNIDVAGLHASAGMQAYRNRVPPKDAACVVALRQRGAVVIGKTLMDEAAFGALGDNPWFGRCHNPARHGCTAGGSSAGSAAAVAAGLCDAALGTDTLGSVRIPASYCGVVGFVPSPGIFPVGGVMPLAPSFDRVGVLAKTVDMAGRLAGIAPGGTPRVIEAEPLDWTGLRRAALLLVEREGAEVHAALLADPDSAISPGLRKALGFGRNADDKRLAGARETIERLSARIQAWFESADVVMLPTTPQTAFPFDAPVPDNQADFTVPASILGLPAISVPLGKRAGLPVGMQLLARRNDDSLLLAAAARLEAT
jgi:aspartyl-tRNA(Asn)/glutamyl-tRNA(Gln) amidotransferase subunit A